MWVWWVIGAGVVLVGTGAVRDRRRHSEFRRALPPDLSSARRREALRLHRAELSANHHQLVTYRGGSDMHGGGGYLGGFDGGGFDGGGCGGDGGC